MQHIFQNKRVFLTGHTGFKGSWLLQILHQWGADVKGYSLAPEQDEDLYHQIKGDELCYSSVIADIRNLDTLKGEMVRFEPHFVFHLAAQALVRRSYRDPIDNYTSNVMGTVNVLEAMRSLPNPCVGVMITTDKVYENNEQGVAFKEDDKLGGHDPYSASKAACEIVIDSYRKSFFHEEQEKETYKSIASARAGNVIGGGDYSEDRLIPDIVRAVRRLEKVVVRNPKSTRPWQHVLEPLAGYLQLAAHMFESTHQYNSAFNFGPEANDNRTVLDVAEIILNHFPGNEGLEIHQLSIQPHEANLLMLDSGKAKQQLNWHPKLNSEQALEWTAQWYGDKTTDAREKCKQQIEAYFNLGT